ncbi:hypothetical protein SAMN04488116_0503 [Flagellimonas flava]|uniref:Uncharacterized protein n=1 Tax=Flagellimonas flava TaxID=570519 RepID=A0A1M5I7G5_9FLAO|nr:hypothetical protein SAMN04488116_0503 [Allomuricauda flava]
MLSISQSPAKIKDKANNWLLNKSEYCYVCGLNHVHGNIQNYHGKVLKIL